MITLQQNSFRHFRANNFISCNNLHNTIYDGFTEARQIQVSEVQVDGNWTASALANIDAIDT